MTDARSLLVGSLAASFAISAWRGWRERGKLPPPRAFTGLAVATVFLVLLAQFSEDLAAALAVLVLVAVALGQLGGR